MNRIYVFSSTGNNLKLAKNLAEKLMDCEILSIPYLMKQEKWVIEGDNIGFVFPCYYGTIPQLVQRFIQEARSIDGNYFFALVSAGRSTGIALSALKKSLEKRNQTLHYGRSIMMVSNYMNGWYYSMLMPDKEERIKLSEQADQLSKEAAEEILESAHQEEKSSNMNYLIPQILSPSRYTKDTRSWDSEFSVSQKCTGCGTCLKACPVENIVLKQGKPDFKGNCQRCMACIQYCPTKAFSIQGKPMNKAHYSHMDIPKKELFQFHQQGRIQYTGA